MNHGSRSGPISAANWPGITRPVLCTNRSGKQTAGGKLFRGTVASPAIEAMHGGGVLPIRALFKASGLPESCYDLLRASLEVMRSSRAKGDTLDPETFGARLVETLMTKLDTLTAIEMAALLDLVSKLAAERARGLAKRLQADFVKAA